MSEQTDRLRELRIDRSEPSNRSWTGWIVALLLLAAIAAAALWWWRMRASAPIPVTVATVEQSAAEDGPIRSTVLDATGYVTARRRATVSSKITGKIVEVLVEEGMAVREGQVLARLDDSLQRRQLTLDEARLAATQSSLSETEVRIKEAKLQLDRRRQLVAAEVSSQSELDGAEASYDSLVARLDRLREDVRVAERQLSLDRQRLEDTVIRAPFTGVAIAKNAQPGEMISPTSAGGGFTRTGVCTLVDMESLEIEVDVNEAFITRVQPEQPVTAVLDAYPNWEIPAAVITTVPAADRQRATVRVRIAFDQLDDRILPDMGVKVSFLEETETTAPEAEVAAQPRLLIPENALRKDEGQDIVFVVRDQTAARQAVRLGARADGRAVIEAGLKRGDQVIVDAPEDLADGVAVTIRTDA